MRGPRRGWAVARWEYDPSQLRPGGYISGPTQFTLADTAIWFAVFTVIGISPMAVTTDLSISFLRPATGSDLWAEPTSTGLGGPGSPPGCCFGWTATPTVPFPMPLAAMPARRISDPVAV